METQVTETYEDLLVQSYYEHSYSRIHTAGRLGFANQMMHSSLEARRGARTYSLTLELGAGSNEHLLNTSPKYDHYIATDVRPLQKQNFQNSLVNRAGHISLANADALNLPFKDHSVDRIVAGCLILHLHDVSGAIREWQRVCSPHGVIDFLVPCDPGVFVRLFRRLISERQAERVGVTSSHYRHINAIEHVNSFNRVLALTKAVLDSNRQLKVRYRPFGFIHSWNLNAYAIVSIEPGVLRLLRNPER